jgi:tRNA G18 (ribose-2'-O)-methylase SpoU
MGTALGLPMARHGVLAEVIDALDRAGYTVHALTPDQKATDLTNVVAGHGRVAIVLGSERQGLSTDALERIESHVRIPMADGVDSLNVAAAAAVACYALIGRSRTELDD